MTKRQQITALLKEGFSYTEIVKRTRFSYQYVANIAMDLKRPGCLNTSVSEYQKRNPGKSREWRKNNPEKRRKGRKKIVDFHQERTLGLAHNKCQRWTIKELDYLEEHGKEMTTHQLVLKLGRSFLAVRAAAHTYNINLKGDKVGAGAAKFIGTYEYPEPINAKTAQA